MNADNMVAELQYMNEYKDYQTSFFFKLKDDPRVTRVGKILRKTSLDELPQLVNVLRGDMTLVGPRAEVPEFVAVYTPAQRKVLSVRPGLTGPGQLEQPHARIRQHARDREDAADRAHAQCRIER